MNMTEWAAGYLASNGFSVATLAKHIQTTPWSGVIQFITTAGSFYLKQTPPALFLESNCSAFERICGF